MFFFTSESTVFIHPSPINLKINMYVNMEQQKIQSTLTPSTIFVYVFLVYVPAMFRRLLLVNLMLAVVCDGGGARPNRWIFGFFGVASRFLSGDLEIGGSDVERFSMSGWVLLGRKGWKGKELGLRKAWRFLWNVIKVCQIETFLLEGRGW